MFALLRRVNTPISNRLALFVTPTTNNLPTSHLSPSHLSPSHLSPSHLSPSHLSTYRICRLKPDDRIPLMNCQIGDSITECYIPLESFCKRDSNINF
jgi:hypothetical protein